MSGKHYDMRRGAGKMNDGDEFITQQLDNLSEDGPGSSKFWILQFAMQQW